MVTGAAAGLGRAEAIGLARSGATVVVNDIAAALDNLRRASTRSPPPAPRASPSPATSAQRSTADELVATADGLGGLNIVVNNAGITRDRMLFNMSDEDWDAVIAVHLRGHFLLTRNAAAYWRAKAKEAEAAPSTAASSTPRRRPAWSGPVGQANYGAAKAGITALTLSAARALGRYGVRANAICPRARTAMTADVFGDAPELADGEIDPLSPEHVVTLVRFLASPGVGRGQRTGVHRLRSDGDAGGGADGGAAVQRGRPMPGTRPDLSDTLQNYFADRDPERTFSATELMDQ